MKIILFKNFAQVVSLSTALLVSSNTTYALSLFPEDPCGPVENPGGGGGGITQTVNSSDSTGAKYRKISTLGFPIPDEKPQQAKESDEEPEETFVDAFSHSLTHQVTDIYVPMEGTDLKLTVRRNWSPEMWNSGASLKPVVVTDSGGNTISFMRPDRPFGAGWTSNVTANIRFEYATFGTDATSVAYVTDENGSVYRFLICRYIGTDVKFFPMPESRHQQEVLATSLQKVDATTYVFKRKFGTIITFRQNAYWADINHWVNPYDVYSEKVPTSYTWARLDKIEDKFGTKIQYGYQEENDSLIPNTMSCRGKTITIESLNDRVVSITDPRGKIYSYEYGVINLEGALPGPDFLDQSYDILSSVVRPDDSETKYFYEGVHELESLPDYKVKWHYSVDLAKITDPNNHSYEFSYQFDRSHKTFSTDRGWYVQAGSPRNVVSVKSPGGHVASFQNLTDTTVFFAVSSTEVDGTTIYTYTPTLYGEHKMKVTDVRGGVWDYDFKDPVVSRLKELEDMVTLHADPHNAAFLAFFQTMEVHTPENQMFVATFEGAAGMALKTFKDVGSSHVNSFKYEDPFDFTLHSWLPTAILPEIPTQNWQDPTSQTNGKGDIKSFTYNETWRVMSSITDEEGRLTLYTIDGSNGNRTKEQIKQGGTVVQETDFDYSGSFKGIVTKRAVKKLTGDPTWATDVITEYELDVANGNVLKEKVGIAPNQRVTEYTYDANNNKLTSKDPRGNITSFVYDDLNRLTQVNLPGGVNKKIFYDARGNKIREDDELGHSTLREYDGMNRVVKEARDMNGDHAINAGDLITETTYNSLGAKTSVKTPNGWTTTMSYDGLNRLVKTTDPYTKETTFEYGTNSGGLQFGRDFQPVRVVDARGFETLTTYDANFRPIEKKVQYAGLGGSKVYATTKWEYDAVGNVIKEYDPLHTTGAPRVTAKTYDALNRETSTTWPNVTSTHSYYTSTGLKWKVEDELNNDTLTEYDDAGRPTKVSSPVVDNGFGTNVRAITLTSYDAAGNVLTTTNPLGKVWTYTYDNRNRKLTEVRPTAGSPTFKWFYDAVGNVTKTTDALNNSTNTAYDAANRVVEVKQPTVTLFGGGGVQPTVLTAYDANGNATKVTDPNGHETVNVYDKLNRLVTTTDAEGIVVTNEYDEVGNRTAVIDGKSQRTEFAYDGLKRNTKVTDAANKSTTFEYNAVDKTARVDAMGQRTEYGYDLKHRMTTVNYVGRSEDNRTYTYDATNNLLSVTEPHPSKAGIANVAYTYDALKRQLSEFSAGLTHTYKYDLTGNRVSVVYGGTPSFSLVSTYDEENRLSTLTEDTRITSYTYDKNGNILVKSLPNGDTQTSVFDAINRTKTLTGTSGIGGALYSYAYQFDAASNVKRIVETYPSVALNRIVNNFYDDINRLTEETVNGTSLTVRTYYTYDNANNRATMTKGTVTTNYTYNNLNQLTGWSDGTKTSSYTYDDNGNKTQQTVSGTPVAGLYWDFENRLIAFEKPVAPGIGIYAFYYDYRSRRVQRVYALTFTKISFSGGVSVREISGGAPVVDYVRGSDWGGGVGGILYSLRGGVPSFTHYNRRGDVTAKTDASGTITYQSQYEAFGRRTVETGATLDRQKSNTKDEDIPGYANEGFRFRDLETGVFLSRDPAGFVDGPNLYTYVVQNPWTTFDPEGLDPAFSPGIGMFAKLNAGQTVAASEMGAKVGIPVTIGMAVTMATGGAAAPVIGSLMGSSTGAVLATAALSGATGGVATKVTSNAMNGVPLAEGTMQAAVLGAGLNVAGAVVGQSVQAFNQGVREGIAISTASNLAQNVAANGASAGAANAMVSVEGAVVTGLSKNAGGGGISSNVSSMYGTARTTCAEARSLTQAEAAGINMQGGTSATVAVGGRLPLGTPMPACNQACAPVLQSQGIGDAVLGTRGTPPVTPPVPLPVVTPPDKRQSSQP